MKQLLASIPALAGHERRAIENYPDGLFGASYDFDHAPILRTKADRVFNQG
jgi:hypothetical protein